MEKKYVKTLIGFLASTLIISCSHSGSDTDTTEDKISELISKRSSSEVINKNDASNVLIKNDSSDVILQNESQSLTSQLSNNDSSGVLDEKLKQDSSQTITKDSENTSQINKIDVSLIPIKFSIQYKNGNGSKNIAVFLDLNNDYSKQFISEIPEIKNTTVNVFMANGDDSIIDKIYCSEDPKQSLSSYLNSLKMDSNNRNCDKDGLEYINKYISNNLSDKQFPIIIFEDGNFVENATNATPELINKYNSSI